MPGSRAGMSEGCPEEEHEGYLLPFLPAFLKLCPFSPSIHLKEQGYSHIFIK